MKKKGDIHVHTYVPLLYNINSGCVLECRDTSISHCMCNLVTFRSLYPSLYDVQVIGLEVLACIGSE